MSTEIRIDLLRGAVARKGVHAAYLFGSYARGDADRYSDLDLLIVQETERPFLERFRDFDSVFDLGPAVELLIYTPEEFERMQERGNPLMHEVLRTGRKIL